MLNELVNVTRHALRFAREEPLDHVDELQVREPVR
jgi:hypothetical protein